VRDKVPGGNREKHQQRRRKKSKKKRRSQATVAHRKAHHHTAERARQPIDRAEKCTSHQFEKKNVGRRILERREWGWLTAGKEGGQEGAEGEGETAGDGVSSDGANRGQEIEGSGCNFSQGESEPVIAAKGTREL